MYRLRCCFAATVQRRVRQVFTAVLTVLVVAGCEDLTAPVASRSTATPDLQMSGMTIIDLGTLGGNGSSARGINRWGHVVGSSTTSSGQTHAFLWTAEDGMRDLLPDEGYSAATGINDHEQVVGDGAGGTPFRWSEAEGLRNLGALDVAGTYARGINNLGQVVGYSYGYDADQASTAFIWTEEAGMRALAGVPPVSGPAYAINDFGQVVGQSWGTAYVWTEAEGMREAGTVDGCCGGGSGINNRGHTVGWSWASGEVLGFLSSPGGSTRDLPTLGGPYIVPWDVNEAGQVVGSSYTASGQMHAFLWTETEGMRDLGTLGGAYSEAFGINDQGQVVGVSTNAAGQSRAVMWTTSAAPPALPPNAPSSATARPTSSRSVALTWTDNSEDESGFRIERSLDGGGSWSEIAQLAPNVTSYGDGGRDGETGVCYRVLAFSGAGPSALSNAACTTPPAAPSNLAATGDALTPWSKVSLTWLDNSSVEDSYEIQRCTGTGCGSYAVIATVSPNTASYSDAAVAVGTTYGYRVLATNDGGISDVSNAVTATTAPAPNAPPVARYTWSCTNKSCTFDGRGSTDDAGIVSYSWTFGDGKSSTGPAVSHTFAGRSTYTVRLTVVDNGAPAKSGSVACAVTTANSRSSGSCR